MTNEEAYKWLYVHFAPCGDETKQDEAISIALKAIAKQVPKKPVISYGFSEKIREKLKKIDPQKAEYKTECCPVCGHPLGISQFVKEMTSLCVGDDYCKRCGQAIDWRDGER